MIWDCWRDYHGVQQTVSKYRKRSQIMDRRTYWQR